MKKVSVILFVIQLLLLLPAAIFDFAPVSVVAVLDLSVMQPYVYVSIFFTSLLYTLMGTAFWAAVSVIYTAVCMAIAGKRGELTPLYGCIMPLLCVMTIVCHIAAPDFVAAMGSV